MTSSSFSFRVLAPAKLNLFLHVTGKRENGYHELQSLIGFTDIGDVLSFSPARDFHLDIAGPYAAGLDKGAGNLVYKAAKLLAETYKLPLKAHIHLEKNLPVAAGLGGGSSDAAAALKGLSRLWDVPLDQNRMQDIAAHLGADVPACLMARPLLAEGIGEKITPVDLQGFSAVLVNPNVQTLTAAVFKNFKKTLSPAAVLPQTCRLDMLQNFDNDLTEAAIATTPAIAQVLRALQQTPGCRLARMSGSGATCFGIFDDASKAAQSLREQYPAWWIQPANIAKEAATSF